MDVQNLPTILTCPTKFKVVDKYAKVKYLISPPEELLDDPAALQTEEQGSDPVLLASAFSPPSTPLLSRASTITDIQASTPPRSETSHASEDRPGLISGLTDVEKRMALVLNSFEVDRILKDFM